MPPVPPVSVEPAAPTGSAGTGEFTGEWDESVWKGAMPWVSEPEIDEKEAPTTAAEPLWCAEARYAWLTAAASGWSGEPDEDEATEWAAAGLTVK